MKTLLILFTLVLAASAQESFNFTTLDKLGAKAKEKTNVSLDASTLKMMGSLLGNDQDHGKTDDKTDDKGKRKNGTKAILNGLTAIQVRSFEFAREGQYNAADVAAFRTYLDRLHWKKIVDTKEAKESSEVYMLPLPNDELGGLAVINLEPKEVTVVYLSGTIKRSDLAKLGGNMGIPDDLPLPDIKITHGDQQ